MAILFLPLIFVLGYFLLVRPQQNQARNQRALLNNLEIGLEVQTAGGIVGRVVDLDDQFVQLHVGPGTTITFVRSAVARILSAPIPDDLSDLDEAGPDEGETAHPVEEAVDLTGTPAVDPAPADLDPEPPDLPDVSAAPPASAAPTAPSPSAAAVPSLPGEAPPSSTPPAPSWSPPTSAIEPQGPEDGSQDRPSAS